jgi:hypothetical protein
VLVQTGGAQYKGREAFLLLPPTVDVSAIPPMTEHFRIVKKNT